MYRVEVANSRHPRELLDGERLASLGSSKGGGVIAQLGKFVIVDVESDKYETFPPDCLVAIDAEELLINTTA